MLIVSEAGEALEAARKDHYAQPHLINAVISVAEDDRFDNNFRSGIKDTFEDEIADILIRLLDLSAYMEIDINAHVLAKMRYNSSRPHKHGKLF